MIWFWGVLCAVALLVLFFPFVFWIEFKAQFPGIQVSLFFFKKKLYTYTKTFGKDQEEPVVAESRANAAPEKESKAPPAEKDEGLAKEPEVKSPEPEPAPEPVSQPVEIPAAESAVKSEAEPATEESRMEPAPQPVDKSETKSVKEPSEKKPETKAPDKEEKRSLTDQEFWTLLLTPEFDSRAWWAVKGLLGSMFSLFKIRFVGCFVEGIRMDYRAMGYGASVNAFLKGYPHIGDWDFRMDWTQDHELRSEGRIRASVNLSRLLGLAVAFLFYGGAMAIAFWRRRRHILKTGELPELGFIRTKIVKMMSED